MAITRENSGAAIVEPLHKGNELMAKVRITSGTIISGRDVRPGEVVEVGTMLGKQLIHCGKAVPATDDKPQMMTREKPEAEKPAKQMKAK